MKVRNASLFALITALVGLATWFAWSRRQPNVEVATASKDATNTPSNAARPAAPSETPTETARTAPAPIDERRATEPAAKTADGPFVIRGRVSDARGGDPWFGATIEARYHDGDAFLEASSDEEGLYRIELDGGAPPRVDLVAFVEDRAAVMHAGLPTDTGLNELVVDFALPGAFSVSGRVLDAKTRAPIAGAELKVFASGAAFSEGWDDGVSDEQGRFHIDEFTDLPRTGLDLIASAEEHQPAHLANLAVPENADSLVVDVLLGPPLRLHGRVLDAATGAPIADARVETSSRVDEFEDGGDETRTGLDGTFELGVGELAVADAWLYVQAKGYATQRLDDLTTQLALEIRLLTPRTLRGRVIDAATGTPVGAAELTLTPSGVAESAASDYADTTVAGADGQFALAAENVPIGAARLDVHAEGFAARAWEILVPADQANGALELKLERSLVVRGRVTRLADGAPVKGARVRAIVAAERSGRTPNASTEKDGAFEVELAVSAAREARWVLEYQGRRHSLGVLAIPANAPAELVHDFTLDLPAPRGVTVEKPGRPANDDKVK
ncbi:MAG: carboxypeptidase-like regulatory domain-containing protein [Planctomycetes bacterium]|nr:carboxypeptidase-like regulatory domain-containing protein [Planctomycetota bacterium]